MAQAPRVIGRALRDERGSVLLLSLVLIAIMTVLGAALFDLAVLENRLALTSHADARAFEAAQAGIERALRELLNDYLSDGPGNESWANSLTLCTPICSTITFTNADTLSFRALTLPNSTLRLPGAAGPWGRYEVQIKLLQADAEAAVLYGEGCTPDASAPQRCRDLIWVRSTGIVDGTQANTGAPPGYVARRTIQVLARAQGGGLLTSGILAGPLVSGEQPISGDVLIAGPVHIVRDPVSVPAMALASTAGLRNNWAAMSPAARDRLPQVLPLVCPISSPGCGPGSRLESLRAQLFVAGPPAPTGATNTIQLNAGTATLGEASDTAAYGTPARAGKGQLDTTGIANGCQSVDCSDSVSQPAQVFVDGNNLTRPYPFNPAPAFPRLQDSVIIGSTSYNHLACFPGMGGCAAGADFWTTHAARLDTQSPSGPCSPNCAAWVAQHGNLGAMFGAGRGLHPSNPNGVDSFCHRFTFTKRNGTPDVGQIRWIRSNNASGTLQFSRPGAPGPACDLTTFTLAPPTDPLLIWFSGDFRLSATQSSTITYEGAAVVIARNLVKVDGIVAPRVAAAPCNQAAPSDGGTCFPNSHMLAVLTFGQMELGSDVDNVDPIMGFFYAGTQLVSPRGANVIGNVVAPRMCFRTASAPCPVITAGGIPKVFFVPTAPGVLPEELTALGGIRRWTVTSERRFWLECRRGGEGVVLPTDVSGICGY